MTRYFDGMGNDVTGEVLKWKEEYDSQMAKTPETVCEDMNADEYAKQELEKLTAVEKTDKSKKRKRR